MNTRVTKKLTQGLVALALVVGPWAAVFSATIQIQNNLPEIQQTATAGFGYGYPSISIFYAGGPVVGVCVPGKGSCFSGEKNPFVYPKTVNAGDSVSFGVQLNASRIPVSGGKCDQLCNHVTVSIASDGLSCAATNTPGTCGSNPDSPKWTATLSTTGDVCTVSITGADIPSKTACSCSDGGYPCSPPSAHCTVGQDCPP